MSPRQTSSHDARYVRVRIPSDAVVDQFFDAQPSRRAGQQIQQLIHVFVAEHGYQAVDNVSSELLVRLAHSVRDTHDNAQTPPAADTTQAPDDTATSASDDDSSSSSDAHARTSAPRKTQQSSRTGSKSSQASSGIDATNIEEMFL